MSSELVRKAAELASALESVGVGFDTAQSAAEHGIVAALIEGNNPCDVLERNLEYFYFQGRKCISSLFVWGDTPEGHNFWSEVAHG